jgi:tRNA uridine 5-carboxymethylaminomethyl modification enzyme
MFHVKHFEVIVVGGGHAGAEAAYASAALGVTTLLVTGSVASIGRLSCNPAVGGVGKGHLVREIDALGGIMGRVTDRATVQYRVLNKGKGPAVWSPRAQVDTLAYPVELQRALASAGSLSVMEGTVVRMRDRGGRIVGVELATGETIDAAAVVISCGTFLGGVIHLGKRIEGGGRRGEPAVKGLTASLADLGLAPRRFKTGTPPRVEGGSVDFSKMIRQDGDEPRGGFSFFETRPSLTQLPCWITATSEATHALIRERVSEAPLFSGQIKARGPRYCPSIEDKVVRFPERPSHLVFVEPEGRTTNEFYLNGLSTSTPEDLQREIVRSVRGLERAEIARYGYAIEYDYFLPQGLLPTLESKCVRGLYLAGQVNGTTGYEEAAAQGFVAGVNAASSALGREEFVLRRTDGAIGVLIDDLVTKGVTEPYRMFTSRIEYRLTMRADNADLRLSALGRRIGTLSAKDYDLVMRKRERREKLSRYLEEESLTPRRANEYLRRRGTKELEEPMRLSRLLRRPGVEIGELLSLTGYPDDLPPEEVLAQVELEAKYEGYFTRERREIEKMKKREDARIPEDFPYERVWNLSTEAREKLTAVKPRSLGQASRISGVSVSDLAAIAMGIQGKGVSRETFREGK